MEMAPPGARPEEAAVVPLMEERHYIGGALHCGATATFSPSPAYGWTKTSP